MSTDSGECRLSAVAKDGEKPKPGTDPAGDDVKPRPGGGNGGGSELPEWLLEDERARVRLEDERERVLRFRAAFDYSLGLSGPLTYGYET